MKKFVAVAGNIGVGKSTLVGMLCERFQWEPYFEPVNENPYLEDFYEDMKAWAFHSQVFFITHRIRSHRQLLAHPTSVIQDRTLYEDAEIFAKNLHLTGQINERDYASYRELYELLIELLSPPDLVINLQASVATLRKRILSRGREFESQISTDYLSQLNDLYAEWTTNFDLCPVLTVPADDLDFVTHPSHLELIIKKIEDNLNGKKALIFEPDEIDSLRN